MYQYCIIFQYCNIIHHNYIVTHGIKNDFVITFLFTVKFLNGNERKIQRGSPGTHVTRNVLIHFCVNTFLLRKGRSQAHYGVQNIIHDCRMIVGTKCGIFFRAFWIFSTRSCVFSCCRSVVVRKYEDVIEKKMNLCPHAWDKSSSISGNSEMDELRKNVTKEDYYQLR